LYNIAFKQMTNSTKTTLPTQNLKEYFVTYNKVSQEEKNMFLALTNYIIKMLHQKKRSNIKIW